LIFPATPPPPQTEPAFRAVGAFSTALDDQMTDLYGARFGAIRDSATIGFKTGDDAAVPGGKIHLRDSIDPDVAFPRGRHADRVAALKIGHKLPKLPQPRKAAAAGRAPAPFHSTFAFRDISASNQPGTRRAPTITSDTLGRVRYATNREELYRSWTPRYWSILSVRGKAGLPFADDELHVAPPTFRLR
jgi:hypothetical protein